MPTLKSTPPSASRRTTWGNNHSRMAPFPQVIVAVDSRHPAWPQSTLEHQPAQCVMFRWMQWIPLASLCTVCIRLAKTLNGQSNVCLGPNTAKRASSIWRGSAPTNPIARMAQQTARSLPTMQPYCHTPHDTQAHVAAAECPRLIACTAPLYRMHNRCAVLIHTRYSALLGICTFY